MAKYQQIGIGTYKLQDELCTRVIKSGLELGYRQIDTAQLYHNHEQISTGIKLSGVPREEIFLISKIHNSNIKKNKISESVDLIKKELGIDYIDLILLHNSVKGYELAWDELIRIQTHMNVRHIGVSNFNINHLESIISKTNIVPFINQIELNIFNQQEELIKYNKSQNIITQSHTTLTKGNLLNNIDLINLSNKIGLSSASTMFKFVLDQDIGILPKTTNFTNLKSNYELINMEKIFDQDFLTTNEDLIKKLDIKYHIY